MPIYQPSQYQCDKMERGDIVVVHNRSILYKFIRKYFKKDLPKIKVRKSWDNELDYNIYYQEDCVLLYEYEVKCIQIYDKEVPYMLSLAENDAGLYTKYLNKLKIGLQNVQITLASDVTITIPTSYFKQGIEANERIFNSLEDRDKILKNIKFKRYNGDYFYRYVKQNNITEFEASYCPVCGNPVIFRFLEDVIIVDNDCNCGNTVTNMSQMSYEDLSMWYASVLNDSAIKRNTLFWFGDANSNEK